MRRCCALPARDRDRAEPIIIDGEAGTGSNEAYLKKEPQVFGPRGEVLCFSAFSLHSAQPSNMTRARYTTSRSACSVRPNCIPEFPAWQGATTDVLLLSQLL